MDVRVEGLHKTYRKLMSSRQVEAVIDANFEIKKGEIFALLGPNGAGKSTLIKMIAGLITPTSGKIYFDNKLPGRHGSGYEHLSAVLEGMRNVYWRLTPLENLHYFANLRGVPSRKIAPLAERYLEELDIDAKKKNQSRHLSRGMLQKLALAAALITDPQILLLDEPTLGVDVASARKIKTKIRELAGEGKTILLTTHQMELVDRLADRVGIISGGRLIREGTLNQLKRNTKKYLYSVSLKGRFALPKEWSGAGSNIGVVEISKSREISEYEIDCKDKGGLGRLLNRLAESGAEVISIRQKQDDLEDVFLRSIEGGAPAKSGI